MLSGLPKVSVMRSKIEDSVVKIELTIGEEEKKLFELIELQRRLKEEMMPLPMMQKQVLSLRYIDGCNFKTIAQTLRLSVSYVFQQHRRGLKKILS